MTGDVARPSRAEPIFAGISGLSAGYELRKAGYACTTLEARPRVGGRNWTGRGGDTVDFADGRSQRCEFDSGLYWNAGPARLPSHHHTVLGYCRELGVRLAAEVNTSRSAERLHPGHGAELRRPIGVNWAKVPYSLGEAAHWRDGQAADYQRLNRPDGPFWFAGDYLAKVGTWQESAMTSARSVINRIDAMRRARA